MFLNVREHGNEISAPDFEEVPMSFHSGPGSDVKISLKGSGWNCSPDYWKHMSCSFVEFM